MALKRRSTAQRERRDGGAHRVAHDRQLIDVERRLRIGARTICGVDRQIGDDVGGERQLERALADVVAHRRHVVDVEDQKLLIAAGDIAHAAMGAVDAHAGIAGLREVQGRAAARDGDIAVGVAHAAIDERAIAAASRAHHHRGWKSVGRHRRTRDRHHDARLFAGRQLGHAAFEHDAAAGIAEGRLALLVHRHLERALVDAVCVEHVGLRPCARRRGRQRAGVRLELAHPLGRVPGGKRGERAHVLDTGLGERGERHVIRRMIGRRRAVAAADGCGHHRCVGGARKQRHPLQRNDRQDVGRAERSAVLAKLHLDRVTPQVRGRSRIDADHEDGSLFTHAAGERRQRHRVERLGRAEEDAARLPKTVGAVHDIEQAAHERDVLFVGVSRHVDAAVDDAVVAGERRRIEVGSVGEICAQRALLSWRRVARRVVAAAHKGEREPEIACHAPCGVHLLCQGQASDCSMTTALFCGPPMPI